MACLGGNHWGGTHTINVVQGGDDSEFAGMCEIDIIGEVEGDAFSLFPPLPI